MKEEKIYVRLDEALKEQSKKIFEKEGLTLSMAIRMYLIKVVKDTKLKTKK